MCTDIPTFSHVLYAMPNIKGCSFEANDDFPASEQTKTVIHATPHLKFENTKKHPCYEGLEAIAQNKRRCKYRGKLNHRQWLPQASYK
eukprot:5964914-Amphidinium_carterae.1